MSGSQRETKLKTGNAAWHLRMWRACTSAKPPSLIMVLVYIVGVSVDVTGAESVRRSPEREAGLAWTGLADSTLDLLQRFELSRPVDVRRPIQRTTS